MSREELEAAATSVGEFGSDNRAGVPGTLHRISALRSRSGAVVGLTCRVGRAVSGHADMVRDILEGEQSQLQDKVHWKVGFDNVGSISGAVLCTVNGAVRNE